MYVCVLVSGTRLNQLTNERTNGRANERLQLNVCARTPANNMIDEMHNGTVIFYADSNWVIYRLLFLPFGSAFREFKCANNRSEQNVLYNDFGWAIRPMQNKKFGISKRLRFIFIFIFWQWNTKSQRVIEREVKRTKKTNNMHPHDSLMISMIDFIVNKYQAFQMNN